MNIKEKSTALLMCLTDPSGDPRPYRTIELCNNMGLALYVASFPPKKEINACGKYIIEPPSNHIKDKIKRKILAALSLFFSSQKHHSYFNEMRFCLHDLKKQLRSKQFDIIIVEDLYLLPLAQSIRADAKIIFDAREYYPEQLSGNLLWRITERFNCIKICKEYLKLCDVTLTVSTGLADAYKKNFNIDCHLIYSAPQLIELAPNPVQRHIRMVHHGAAMRGRNLENMIDIFKHLDNRFSLDFYLVGDSHYIEELKRLAKPYPQVRFCDPVEYLNIIKMLSLYDIGLCLFEPGSFNTLHALPNKFFEFIQARLMLAIGPSPDMAQLVREHDCGIVSESFSPEDLGKMLNRLTAEDIFSYKNNAHIAASTLCWETEGQKYKDIILNLLGRGNAV